jgi:hypothetical protein
MKTVADHGLVLVDVLDANGYETGRTVGVELWWVTEYYLDGEDVDGRRGTPWQDTTILDAYINPAAMAGLNSAQVEQVLRDAKGMVERGQRV